MTLEKAIQIATDFAYKKYNSLSYLKDRGYKEDYNQAKEIADAIFEITKVLNTKKNNNEVNL